MRFIQVLFGATLFLAPSIMLAQEPKATVVTISEPGQVSLAALFAQADVVAFVQIRSGDAEHFQAVLYKASVTKSYKGSKAGDVIYFTPFTGYSIGNEYLVFLRKTPTQIADIVNAEAKALPLAFDRNESFYRIMYEGYSVMPVSYECAFEEPQHQTCDYAVKFVTDHVTLPAGLKVFPADRGDPELSRHNFVRRTVVEAVLEGLRIRQH